VSPSGGDSPWRNDHPWHPAGGPGELERRGRKALFWGAAAAAVLLPWNGLAAGRPDLVPAGAVVVADLVPAALLLRGAWLRRAWRSRGAARLRFERFPFFLGEPFEAELLLGAHTGAGVVEVTLACLERRLLDSPHGPSRREVEVFRSTQVIRAASRTAIAFELPAPEREIGTSLGGEDARRWELRLRGRAGAGVQAAFPVPVYAPPAERAALAG
jgi:hypothetical protein